MEKIIKVKGMHCKSCEILLIDSISEIKGVKNVNADYEKGIVNVNVDEEKLMSQVKKVIEKEGYTVESK